MNPIHRTFQGPIFTADLRQLGLRQAQLYVGVAWKWSTRNPAAPNTFALSSMYLFKRWGDRRVELKAGYVTNDNEFVGLQIGGSTSTSALGVYAVLPNEVGACGVSPRRSPAPTASTFPAATT